MLIFLQKIDLSILNFISDYLHQPFLDKAMPLITYLGDMGLIWFIISLALMLNKKYRYLGVMVITAVLVSTILGEGLLKNLVQRQRPFLLSPEMNILITKPLSYSFPSGHTACAFAAAIVLSRGFKKYRLLIYTLAALIAFSRMYLYVHYPSDILGGIFLGIISAQITFIIFKKIRINN